MKNYFKKIFTNWLFGFEGKKFVRFFNLFNKIIKWPIKLEWVDSVKVYKVIDNDGSIIYVGRPGRISLYGHGIKPRLLILYDQYCLNEVPIIKGDIIIDVGCNIGELSLFLINKFGVNTISIEPEDIEFECLKLNIDSQKNMLVNLPLWKNVTNLELFQHNDSGDSSLIEMPDYKSRKKVTTSTLFDVVDKFVPKDKRIKLLKLEAEGAEPEVLLGGISCLNRIDYIVADVGPERGLKNENTLIEVLEILCSNGFKPIKFIFKRGIILFKKNI